VSELRDPAIEEIESHFGKLNLISLATAEGGQPRVRIVSLIRLDDEFYVITGARGGAETAKVRQIRANPKVEFVMQVEREGKIGNIRAEAVAHIVDDETLKRRLFDEIRWVRDYFSSPEDPSYVLLGLEVRSYEYSVPGRPEVIRLAKR
jgi:uncharacterized pyridoxamine 5'-phosphate oxidase family protein